MAEDREQHIELGMTRPGTGGQQETALLELKTGKPYGRGIASDARVVWGYPGGFSHAFGVGTKGDFSTTLLKRPGIATQKAIDKQHAEVFTPAKIEELKTLAVAHYAGDEVAA
ncbi:hypothetical protein [Edaphobacter modestus]|uniref:Uncharacterized protein n=1 Tax=Edaphobacter modestus TaxID=388466 RepID=A0A4V2G1E8_9BACT|nr:hypothetical protein [Edaphobacter modestus]RZU28956.1 hypothetical protein BDD14_6542 [Edaphobacter modestus]